MDPAVQAAMEETKRRAARDQGDLQLGGEKLKLTAQEQQIKTQIEQSKLALENKGQEREDQRNAADLQARMAMNESDNTTAKQLKALDHVFGAAGSEDKTLFTPASDFNPNPRP
jgi:hypothetical protein